MAGIVSDVLQAEFRRGDADAAWLFGAALALAHEDEFFIRKAIGWALRDHARHAPEAVTAFANAHRQRLSKLSYREALKHQPR
jgi:3-methyladenine DNA glycosylase AlkD